MVFGEQILVLCQEVSRVIGALCLHPPRRVMVLGCYGVYVVFLKNLNTLTLKHLNTFPLDGSTAYLLQNRLLETALARAY